jgi:hypothetical protein
LALGDGDNGEKECVIENLKKSGSALILGFIFAACIFAGYLIAHINVIVICEGV